MSKQKLSAYGLTSSTEAIDSYTIFNDAGKNYDLKIMQELILEKQVQYYFVEENNHFMIPSKKNLIKVCPKHQEDIAAHLKENHLFTDDEIKVDKLIQFLRHLS